MTDEINWVEFEDIPSYMQYQILCEKIKIKDITFMRTIPKKFLTEELCLYAIKLNPYNFFDCIITNKVCLAAVQSVGFLLNCIPKHLRTEEIYLEAYKNDPRVISMIPSNVLRSLHITENHSISHQDERLS
jgi:hypothetical protein